MTDSPEHDGGEVVLYQSPSGDVSLEVRLERDSVWLTQRQMADLLDTSIDNISLHLKNVYGEGELDEAATVEESSIVRVEGNRTVRRSVRHYNLDAVISVGYRVNSARGTQFRIWATRTLRDHLLQGYTLNEHRLREKGLGEMEQAVGLLARTLTQNALVSDEGAAVLDVVRRYAAAWRLLLEYDEAPAPRVHVWSRPAVQSSWASSSLLCRPEDSPPDGLTHARPNVPRSGADRMQRCPPNDSSDSGTTGPTWGS